MDSAIKAANEKLDLVTMDEEVLRYYHLRQMALSDYNSGMEYAREEGLAEGMEKGLEQGMEKGRVEGIAEKALEIAKKMKKAGRPLSEIAEFTDLPAEIIEQM
jgi:predicted transposase/invertase (TIGR01784 family)